MKKYCGLIVFMIFSLAVSFSCTAPSKTVKKEPEITGPAVEKEGEPEIKKEVEKKEVYVPTKEEKESLELFTEILDIIESTDNRESVLPRVEALYNKIINEYPETPLAQESYWKLMVIYAKDYSPPDFEKTEALYGEFLQKYPNSVLKRIIDDTLGNVYYKNQEWGRLLNLCAPVFDEYLEKQTSTSVAFMFQCAEANYKMGKLEEAEKGYQVIYDLYPKTSFGVKSSRMLDELKQTPAD